MNEAKVARIGRREYTREKLPPTTWRRQVQALGYWMLMAVIGVIVWPVLFYLVLRA